MKLLRSPAGAIIGLALLLMVPALISPPMTHDSFWINWVWADQFTTELSRGNLYPRWLPQSHGGLGSPVFYFYPPLAFYLTAAFDLALPTYAAILAAFFAGSLASGFAMYAWLKDSAKAPLTGALLYMAAPYHLLDFYGRGALAEFLAFALIPLIALGLWRATQGRIALATLSYAALILTHLPLALLVSIFFAAPYALYLAWRFPGMLLRQGMALLLGLAISAIYLLPALYLEPYRDAAQLWTDASLRPENWSMLSWDALGPSEGMRAVFAAILFALAVPAFLLLLSSAGRVAGMYATACLIAAAGLVPGLWTLPLLEAVQFPFRLLPLAEFAIATGIAQVGFSRSGVPISLSLALALSIFIAAIHKEQGEFTIDQLAATYPDVPENLPPGERPFSWPSKWALEVSNEHQRPKHLGRYTVAPTFYFPAWEVECQGRKVATNAEPRLKLLAYEGRGCERRLRTTNIEKAGTGISFIGLLILLVFGVRDRFRRSGR